MLEETVWLSANPGHQIRYFRFGFQKSIPEQYTDISNYKSRIRICHRIQEHVIKLFKQWLFFKITLKENKLWNHIFPEQ